MAKVLATFYFLFVIAAALAVVFVAAVSFLRQRNYNALVVCWSFTVVAVWVGREQHWVASWAALPLLWLAGPAVLLGLITLIHTESQR